MTKYILLPYRCLFLDVGRPLWREDDCVVHNCCWASTAQSFSGRVQQDTWQYFTFSNLWDSPNLEGQVLVQEQVTPVILQGTEFSFRRLLRLARLRWKYFTRLHTVVSSLCPMWGCEKVNIFSWVEFILRPTVSRPVRFGIGLFFGAHDQIVFLSFLNDNCFLVLLVGRPLWREDGSNLHCNRWLVRSLRTNNHTLPSHLRLCSLLVASYDSQRLPVEVF
jgi:hypothetical protein